MRVSWPETRWLHKKLDYLIDISFQNGSRKIKRKKLTEQVWQKIEKRRRARKEWVDNEDHSIAFFHPLNQWGGYTKAFRKKFVPKSLNPLPRHKT